MNTSTIQIARTAKNASFSLQNAVSEAKDRCLQEIHSLLAHKKDFILAENHKDCVEAQQKIKEGKLTPALFKRLSLEDKYDSLLSGVLDVKKLNDPTGNNIYLFKAR